MRNLFFLACAFTLLCVTHAFAGTDLVAVLSNYSSVGNATFGPYNVKNYRTKTFITNGHLTNGATTFGNYSGTAAVQCAPTSTGPWTTAVQQDSTAISFTAPGILSWDDACPYVQVKWTKTKHNLDFWIFGVQY